ncbi:MAG TPA: GNAT family N-acetyltransferase [Cytophagaceae bacterium]|jgi:GNAT superfamily N-acetyltransferase
MEILEWDTNVFEKRVCRINHEYIDQGNWRRIVEELVESKVDLAYYSTLRALEDELDSRHFTLSLIDRKTTYKKIIDRESLIDDAAVIVYPEKYPQPIMFDLAVQSGVYSRFALDPNIGHGIYEKIYKAWIINSVNKTLAKEVLIYKEQSLIQGLVTLGEKNSIGDIGIIAVDSKFRGKGIGKKLMRSAESWFAKNTSNKEIQVVTQGNNLPACKLYESCGYEVSKVEYFYHIWKRL